MFSPWWLVILVLIVLLIVGIAIFLYLVLRGARKRSYSPDPQAEPQSDQRPPRRFEFLQYPSFLGLRASFRHALRVLKTYVTGRDYRYQVPWFLLAGEAESGKTTLLDESGLSLAVSEPAREDRQLNWFFFNEAIVIDVAGDFVMRADGTADQKGWSTISRLLQKYRPQRPLDGIVLTIPCEDLLGPLDVSHERNLEQKAAGLYQRLWQSQKILGMRLPVYVLLTRCDEVTGFRSFCDQLPIKLQTQMFGWSNPSTLETAYTPGLIPAAFDGLHEDISRLQFGIYAERDHIENVDDLFLFPSAIQSMRAPLQIYLDCLFKQTAFHESFLFRGLYFCGDKGVGTALETAVQPAIKHWTAPSEALTKPAPSPNRKPVFVDDLFKEKVFQEAVLAQPLKTTLLSRNRLILAAQILSLAIILIGGVGLALTYNGLARQEQERYDFLRTEKGDLEAIEYSYRASNRGTADSTDRLSALEESRNGRPAARRRFAHATFQPVAFKSTADEAVTEVDEQTLHNGEAKLLTGIAKVSSGKFYSVFIPSSWFSGLDNRIQSSIAGAFKFVVFEPLRIDLQAREQKLLDTTAEYADNLDAKSDYRQRTPRTRRESVDNTSPRPTLGFQLSSHVEKLGELRLNLERYGRLIKKDPAFLEDLRPLLEYLEHAQVPDGFDKDNELFQRALTVAEGRPLDARTFYKESARGVGETIEQMYEGSFDVSNVNYDYLKDIAETEDLLTRPEYTWLASYVFSDPHSEFYGMTLSSSLADLKQALKDLRGQESKALEVAPESTRHYQHRVRGVLVWDQEILHQVVALYDQYETFVETRSNHRSEPLSESVKQVARARVKTGIRNLLTRARKYQPLGPVSEGSMIKLSLIEEIRGLQQAQELLYQVLEITGKLSIDSQLRAALSVQAEYLLHGINREFVAQRFYVARQEDFSWWDGRQPASYLAFDLGSAEELAAYLSVQRKGIAFLGRDLAAPVKAFFDGQSIYVPPGDSLVDWDMMRADLDAYDNKTPGNPIAALESFIRTDMDKVSIEGCAGASQPNDQGSTDYFLRIRNSLRWQFYVRCKQLAHIKAINDTVEALETYREIEQSFNQNLAVGPNQSGGFPFAYLSDLPTQPELDPWAMITFFKDLESREKAAREALDRSRKYGGDPARALAFLDQVGKVREFFAPYLEKKQGPVFDFRIQLRLKPEGRPGPEIGGNQIIDWKLEVGKKKFTYLSDDVTGHWVVGDPIRLTLRWANDSPSVPIAGSAPVPVTVKDRTAIFEYDDRWSLFTLLLRHGDMLKRAGVPGECNPYSEAEPYTLKFTIKTAPDPLGQPIQPEQLKTTPAVLFMRVSLVAPNKQEPLVLPCFPTKAPPVPSLHPYVTGKDE